jgi:hypothetical protein
MVRSVIFNLEHEIDSLHFISNGENPILKTTHLTTMGSSLGLTFSFDLVYFQKLGTILNCSSHF